MNWGEVKNKIDKEAEKIIFSPPDEVLKIFKYQIIDSGAGSYDQAFTTMVFCEGDCRAFAYYSCNQLVVIADEPSFTLDHLRYLARLFLPIGPEFQGYCGLKKTWELVQDVLGALDTVKTKEEFKELLNSLNFYVAVVHGWVHHYFPWNIGEIFPQRKTEDIKKMTELMR